MATESNPASRLSASLDPSASAVGTVCDYPQGAPFNAADLWDAYETGARDAIANPSIASERIPAAADAYVKLVHARVRDGEIIRPSASAVETTGGTPEKPVAWLVVGRDGSRHGIVDYGTEELVQSVIASRNASTVKALKRHAPYHAVPLFARASSPLEGSDRA